MWFRIGQTSKSLEKICPGKGIRWSNSSSALCHDQIIQANTFLVFPAGNGDGLKSLLIHLLKGIFSQVWHSHSDEFHTLTPLSEQECEHCLTRWHSSDTSIKCIQCHPYRPQELWKILTFITTSLQKANFARKISILSQMFESSPSYKNPNILFCFNTAFRLHNQRSARNVFYCAHELFIKYLNNQSASGQVSEFLEALMSFLPMSKDKTSVCSPDFKRAPILLQTHEWSNPCSAFCCHSFPPTWTKTILQSHLANYDIRASGKWETLITSQGLITFMESENPLGWKRAFPSVHPALNHQHLLIFTQL